MGVSANNLEDFTSKGRMVMTMTTTKMFAWWTDDPLGLNGNPDAPPTSNNGDVVGYDYPDVGIDGDVVTGYPDVDGRDVLVDPWGTMHSIAADDPNVLR